MEIFGFFVNLVFEQAHHIQQSMSGLRILIFHQLFDQLNFQRFYYYKTSLAIKWMNFSSSNLALVI